MKKIYYLLIMLLSINLSYAKEVENKKLPYYIIFELVDYNKTITFKNINLSEIKVLNGNKNVNVERRNYPNEYLIDFINLKGNYQLVYKKIVIIADGKVSINQKEMTGTEIIVDQSQEIRWDAWINYFY